MDVNMSGYNRKMWHKTLITLSIFFPLLKFQVTLMTSRTGYSLSSFDFLSHQVELLCFGGKYEELLT